MTPFPEDMARFIETNIDSVDQLEILRILAADPQKEWGSATMGREAQIQPQTITLHLDVLDGLVLLVDDLSLNTCLAALRARRNGGSEAHEQNGGPE